MTTAHSAGRLARAGWIVVVVATVGLFAVGVPGFFVELKETGRGEGRRP
jgi:hypothetical protein